MFVRKNGTLVIGFIDGTINFYDPFSFQIILTYHLEGEVRLEVIENLKYSEEKIIVFDSAGAVYELILTEDNQLKKGKEISLQKCTNIKELNNGILLFFNARNHIMHHCEKDNYTIIQTFNKVSSICFNSSVINLSPVVNVCFLMYLNGTKSIAPFDTSI